MRSRKSVWILCGFAPERPYKPIRGGLSKMIQSTGGLDEIREDWVWIGCEP
jgi:hypothetical protein